MNNTNKKYIADSASDVRLDCPTVVKPSASPHLRKCTIAVVVGIIAVASAVVVTVVLLRNNDGNDQETDGKDQSTTQSTPTTTFHSTTTTYQSTAAPTDVSSSTTEAFKTTLNAGKTTTSSQAAQWTPWGSWTACTATCGSGINKRYRLCNSESDQQCIGDIVEQEICTTEDCPVYGKWTTWTGWGSCDSTCGTGSQTRIRSCTKDYTSMRDCIGDNSQLQACSVWKCPNCSQLCDVGRLNDQCDTCVCDSDIRGRVVASSTGYGLSQATIYAASAPTRMLTSTNSTGFFSLTTVCMASEIYVIRAGFLDQTVKVTANDMMINLTSIVQPHFIETPQSKYRLVGENVTLCCRAEGIPEISYYEWFKDSILLDDRLYPNETTLILEDLAISDNGIYKCRANSPVGTQMSTLASITVKGNSEDFCADALQQKTIRLPSDCVQQTNNKATYDVGECISKQCRGNGNENQGFCREDVSSCCTTGQVEMKTVQCTGYSLNVFVITSCACANCTSGSINIYGTVTGPVTGTDLYEPLVFGEVWANGILKTYTSITGSYSMSIPKQTSEIVLAFVDSYLKRFLSTTKVHIPDAMSGTIQSDIIMPPIAESVEIQSTEESAISVSSKSGNSSTGAKFFIPANSFYYTDGTKYEGTVSATITFLDPLNSFESGYIPANFDFINEEGETAKLASLGLFNLFFQDLEDNDLNLDTSVDVYFPDYIATNTNTEGFTLWKLNQGTGKWELPTVITTGGTSKRQAEEVENLIGSIDFTQITRWEWFNIDKIDEQETCFMKLRLFKGPDLTEEILNLETNLYFDQFWVQGDVFSAYWGAFINPSEECGSIICNDVYGFTTATHGSYWKGADNPIIPGDLSITSVSNRFEIDGLSIRVDFSTSPAGMFYTDKQTCLASSIYNNFIPFHYGKTNLEFTVNMFFTFVPPLTLDKGRISDLTWYVEIPNEGFHVCVMKVKIDFIESFIRSDGEFVNLIVTSKGGTADVVAGKTFGIREFEIADFSKPTTLCMEYKCSGTISPFTSSDKPLDNTNVLLRVKGATNVLCNVISESPLISPVSQVGNSAFSFTAPVSSNPDYGLYIAITTSGPNEVASKLSEVNTNCMAGKEQVYDEVNPDIGLAVTFYCKNI